LYYYLQQNIYKTTTNPPPKLAMAQLCHLGDRDGRHWPWHVVQIILFYYRLLHQKRQHMNTYRN